MTEAVAEIPKPEPEAPPVTLEALKIADRCDRCGAQAFVAAQFMDGILLFCGHDFTTHEAKIRETALQVRDDREKINQEPSQSANT